MRWTGCVVLAVIAIALAASGQQQLGRERATIAAADAADQERSDDGIGRGLEGLGRRRVDFDDLTDRVRDDICVVHCSLQ